MKFSISSKILISFLICFIILVISFMSLMKFVIHENVLNAGKTVARGVLLNLEQQLLLQPRSSWKALLKQKDEHSIQIRTIENLQFNASEKQKLNNNEIVYQTGKTYQFLNLVFVKHTAYKKIGQSHDVLVYVFSNPNEIIKHYIQPLLHLIIQDLQSTPENNWQAKLVTLEKIYGYSLQVYATNQHNLPQSVINDLTQQNLAFETEDHSSSINIVYYAFKGGILKIGPLNISPIANRINDLMIYFIVVFFILAICLLIVFSWLLVKNMKKLYLITDNFSQGNFNFRINMSATSVLYGLYENINLMGDKLQQLNESQKNMSRFVAHEIRTPLYTMQLALDSMNETKNLPTEIHDYILSFKEDINQLNDLVKLFLLYSQSTSHELKITKASVNVSSWLKSIIMHHQRANAKITFQQEDENELNLMIDARLLKHVIENILVNALKFAEHQVIVSLAVNPNTIHIIIADDGPGIQENEREKVFDAFAVLTPSQSFGGHVGLGLTIAKAIVELHEGKIVLQHSSLGGCQFLIELPRI